MDMSIVTEYVLPILGAIAIIVLIVVFVQLAKTMASARKTIENFEAGVAPTLKHVETITADLEPVVKQIPPLMERANLTVDALNLELMRVDTILEDVSEITDAASGATAAVGKLANAPVEALSNLSGKIQGAFKAPGASKQSAALGAAKAVAALRKPRAAAGEQGEPAGDAVSAEVAAQGAEPSARRYFTMDEPEQPAAAPAAPAAAAAPADSEWPLGKPGVPSKIR